MKFTITIKCDNAAFDGEPGVEVARILREALPLIEHAGAEGRTLRLRDVNGNFVGQCEWERGDE